MVTNGDGRGASRSEPGIVLVLVQNGQYDNVRRRQSCCIYYAELLIVILRWGYLGPIGVGATVHRLL